MASRMRRKPGPPDRVHRLRLLHLVLDSPSLVNLAESRALCREDLIKTEHLKLQCYAFFCFASPLARLGSRAICSLLSVHATKIDGTMHLDALGFLREELKVRYGSDYLRVRYRTFVLVRVWGYGRPTLGQEVEGSSNETRPGEGRNSVTEIHRQSLLG